MDGYMGRKTAVGIVFSRGGSIPVFREQNFEERSIKCCNRLGCSTRLYCINSIRTGNAEKVKYSRGSFHSMNSKTITGASGSCSTRSSSRACKQVSQQCRYGDQETSSSSCQGAKRSRGGSDILPGSSSSERSLNTLRKRSSNGGGLSARGQSKSASVNSGSPNRGSSVHSLSLPEHSMPQQALSRTGAVFIRARRSSSGVTRKRLSEERREPVTIAQMPQTNFSAVPESSSRSSFIEMPPICDNTYGRPGSSSHTDHSSPISQPEDSNVPMGDGNGYQHFSTEGIAEVLSPLDRIEQDEESTDEQLLVLGMNLSLDDQNFHDQHRDMRMDIDNMTYEELLALE